jgi:peroxiredoxin
MHDPRVPETLEGWSVLHQMFRIRWPEWRVRPQDVRERLAAEAAKGLAAMRGSGHGTTAAVTMLGHKGDLMLIHFRRSFEELQAAQVAVARLGLSTFLEPTTSFVSIVELGMYEMTAQVHRRLGASGLAAGTDAFESAFDAEMEEQRKRVDGRLFVEVPARRHVCFYPMKKRRGEQRGVDLFADDPVVFKKLIYEMRFDEASAWYAEFGPFYVGLQFTPSELPKYLEGAVPAFHQPA